MGPRRPHDAPCAFLVPPGFKWELEDDGNLALVGLGGEAAVNQGKGALEADLDFALRGPPKTLNQFRKRHSVARELIEHKVEKIVVVVLRLMGRLPWYIMTEPEVDVALQWNSLNTHMVDII